MKVQVAMSGKRRVVPKKKKRKLPPDPEKMNRKRAMWADCAIGAFQGMTRTDRGDVLCDLLCDLAHWADYNDEDFCAAIARATMHYDAETSGQGQQL